MGSTASRGSRPVSPGSARVWHGVTPTVRRGVSLTVDMRNAYNSASQGALARAAVDLAAVAPELAACALRSQCSVRPGDGVAGCVSRWGCEAVLGPPLRP